MRATISLLGLYNWDNSILDGLTLPENFTSDDLAALKSNLLMETAEFELLYSDFDFLKFAITEWCNKRKSTWKWLKDTQGYTYNPIWNVDYTQRDQTGEKITNDTTTDFTRTLKTAESGKDTIDREDHKTGSDTTLNSVYAYDDNSNGAPQQGSSVTYNSKLEVDQDTKYGKNTDETGTTKTTVDHDHQRTNNYTKTLQGNYGQTTTQDMIKQEQELAMFNLLDFIITDFKKRFCLLVY